MKDSKFKWNLLNKNCLKSENELIQVLMSNRKLTTEEEKNAFFSEDYTFYNPFLFNEMIKVTERINRAIQSQEKIMIYGDFDVDGVTGTAILYKTLKKLKANVFFYIPNRFTEGYGPNLERFKSFITHGFTLLITVDNGITGVKEALYLKEHNVDLIITDHHEPKEDIPIAYAIIHPKLDGENYPFKELSGCGVSFKLAHALLGYLPEELSDLASLGTYADIVSLVSENRSIVKMGIKQLQNSQHIGLRLMTQIAGIKTIDENALGFMYSPRLNAPGRLDSGSSAVLLLVTEDYDEAFKLANDIESLNNERKAKIDVIMEEAIQIIDENGYNNDNVIVVENDAWHEGVLGIIANRLVDLYHKPVIVLTLSEHLYKGSARTLEDFPLFENLDRCSDLLSKYGGHKMACGLTIEKEQLPIFRERLHDLAGDNLYNVLNIDCIIEPELIHTNITKGLENFRPFGLNNQKPLFLLKDFQIMSIIQMGVQNKHIKMTIKKNEVLIQAVAFNQGALFYSFQENDRVDIVGNFEINEYNNKITNQLIIRDVMCHHKQIFDVRDDVLKDDIFQHLDVQYIYFNKDYGYNNAICFSNDITLSKNIVIIDLPLDIEDLKTILHNENVSNIYLIFKCDDYFTSDHLITRDKLIKIYQTFKKYKRFSLNSKDLSQELDQLGLNKKMQNLAIQVFFELNFVIIEKEDVIVVENPQKRQLNESKTFQSIINFVNIKEKLLLSTKQELKLFINNL